MRRFWLAGVPLALLLAGLVAVARGRPGGSTSAAAAPPAGPPRIALEPARFDFGRVRARRTLQKHFTIRNHGGSDLVIENVSTTCGCTAALLDRPVVEPGGATPLRVTMDTEEAKGQVTRSVLVRSNDPARPSVELTLLATVAAEEG